MADVDILASDDALPASPGERTHVLARVGGWPVGQFLLEGRDPSEWRERLRDLTAEILEDTSPAQPGGGTGNPAAPAPSGDALTVVVPTLGRSPWLVATVRALLAQTVTVREVIVVDNDPRSGAARAALADLMAEPDGDRLRCIAEPRRGVSRARNSGAQAARTTYVAFTDDDATPDASWCAHLLDAVVRDAEIGCVTSLVIPAALTTREHLLFEQYGGFGKGYRISVWCRGEAEERIRELLRPVADRDGSPWPPRAGHRGAAFPYTAGEFGSGVVLFRRDVFLTLGGFDRALGPGTPTCAGEDLDLCRRTYLAGKAVVYHPAAVVRHHHRETPGALADQVHGYGVGLTAALTKLLLTQPKHILGFAARIPAALRMLLSSDSSKNQALPEDFPSELLAVERRGILVGPWRYLRSRWRTR